jgi:hypothetical protein
MKGKIKKKTSPDLAVRYFLTASPALSIITGLAMPEDDCQFSQCE